MAKVFEDIRSGVALLKRFLVPREFSARLHGFSRHSGVTPLMEELGSFTADEFCAQAQRRLGFRAGDPQRRRMLTILIDFLEDCGQLTRADEDGSGKFTYNPDAAPPQGLCGEELVILNDVFAGKVEFYEKCLGYAAEFLRGGAHLYDFNKGMEKVWDAFLGNYEFGVARDVLLKSMSNDDATDLSIMDLCYGMGHGLEVICRDFPGAKITAVDFTDAMRPHVESKLPGGGRTVRWVEGREWKGFGSRLPFDDNAFDRVLFSCGDPYIPVELRKETYRDIYRIIKPGGILGAIAWGYPDREKKHIKNGWIRKGIYIHDFAESVCLGWHGFRDIDETINMARSTGFTGSNVLFNNYYMLDTAVWMFKVPDGPKR